MLDITKGKGRKAKSGDQVSIFYENRLENQNVFSRNQTGEGKMFILNGNDETIIQAWHIGIIGMKVGGKRTIICPPDMAYGSVGAPPFIPGDSKLESTIELIKIDWALKWNFKKWIQPY